MNVTIGGQTQFIPLSATLAEITWLVVAIQYQAAQADPRRS